MAHAFPGDLRDRFAPERVLGSGSFGAVHLARDLELTRAVAVKVLTESLVDPEQRARFEREARVTAGLAHPGVVGVYDHGLTAEGVPYIVYEYIEGRTLADRLDPAARPSLAELTAWGVAVSRALAHAHAAGVLHRDVKPGNIILRADGSPVLCDFGLARHDRTETPLTAAGLIVGTPAYLAPEIWEGADASPASDQFGWAASLYRLAAGTAVYPGDGGILEAAGFLRGGGWIPPLPPDAGPLREVLGRALARDPAERFPSMDEFADALRAGETGGPGKPAAGGEDTRPLAGTAPPARGEDTLVAPRPPPRPGRDLRPALLAGFLAAVLLGFGSFRPAPSPPPPAPATRPPRQEDPEPPELRKVRENLNKVLGEDLTGSYEISNGLRPHLLDTPRNLHDPRVQSAWARYLQVLGPWLRDLPGQVTGPTHGLLELHRATLIHVMMDYEGMLELAADFTQLGSWEDTVPAIQQITAIDALWVEMMQITRDFVHGFAEDFAALGDPTLILLTDLARMARAPALPDLVLELIRRIAASGEPAGRAPLYHSLVGSLGHTASKGSIPCDVLSRATLFMTRDLARGDPGLPPARRPHLRGEAIHRVAVLLRRCPEEAGRPLLQALDALLGRVELEHRTSSSGALRNSLDLAVPELDGLAAPPVGLAPLAARVRELRRGLRAAREGDG